MRLLTMLLISMVVSGYYFPFSFSVLPQLNTKMALAMLGIALVAYQGFQKHRITFSRDLLGAIVFAFIFSFICFVAADYNHTDDYSYVTYFVSFFTWLGGAYVVCYVIRAFHGKATLNLLIAYSAFVCVSQCILAILIDRFSAFPGFGRYLYLSRARVFSGSGKIVWYRCGIGSCRCKVFYCASFDSLSSL